MSRMGSICAVVCVSAALAVFADDDDPVRSSLIKANATYNAEVTKVRGAVREWFDKREDAARKAGNKKALDQLKVETDDFEASGIVPAAAPKASRDLSAQARRGKETAYKAAIKKYTVLKKDAAAAAVEKELVEFQVSTFDFQGRWSAAHSDGWKGERRVSGRKLYDVDGRVCDWKVDGGVILIEWPNGVGWEKLTIDPANADKLVGKNSGGRECTYTRLK